MPAAERPSAPDPPGRAPGTPTVIPSLPLLVEPMIGRGAEANRLSTQICESRLITICGPGGVGKTLLATHVASAVSGDFEAVVFVPLATESDAAQIVPSIATHAGLYVADTRTAHQAVVDTFAGMRALVVLDNLEQLLGDVAGVLKEVLSACPRVHLLATSRVTTGVKGEVGFELDPLAVPPPSATSARPVRDADAVKLLLQEVHRQDPDFAVTTQNASVVAEIVRRLDGLPLAIELAAPRLRVLSVDELLTALDARFDVLRSGHAVPDERHRALAATIEWSYRLLGVDEQRLLRFLSVFGAGFPFEAAVHITGEPHVDVLTRLDRLLEHHLVVREAGPPRRFTLLHSIRDFALSKLNASGEEEDARLAHAQWVADAIGPLTAQLVGPAQADAQRSLDVELGNIRAALSWLCRRHNDDQALRLAAALWSYWLRSGQCREGATWLRQAIDEYEGDHGRSLAVALLAAGDMANELGDDAVDQLLSRSTQIFEALGDSHGVARTRNSSGFAARQRSDLDTAERLHQQALDEFRQQADERWIAIARNGLAAVAYCRGDYGLASSIWRDVVAAFRKLGDERSVARYLSNLGNALAASGDDSAATHAYRRALTSARKVGAKDAELSALTNLAASLYSTNQLDRAVPTLMSALVQARSLGHRLNEAAVLGLLGDCHRAQGRSAASAEHYLQALDLFHACGDRHDAACCLECLAVLAATNSFADVAVQLYAYASASRRRDGSASEEDIQAVETAVNAAAASLTSDEIDRHRRTGETRSFDETLRAVRALVEALQTYSHVDGIGPLTAREVEVLGELVLRRTDPEIAEKLHISVRTVASHVSSVLRKLEVRSRRDVEAAAERHGLVRPA